MQSTWPLKYRQPRGSPFGNLSYERSGQGCKPPPPPPPAFRRVHANVPPPFFFSSKLFLTGGNLTGIKKFLGNNTIINTIDRARVGIRGGFLLERVCLGRFNGKLGARLFIGLCVYWKLEEVVISFFFLYRDLFPFCWMNYSELGNNTRSNEGKRKKRDCLVEIILSSNVLLVLSKRSSIIERSIFVTNFN